MKPLKVALLGCGTVGSAVLRLLTEQSEDLAARIGRPVEVAGIAVREGRATEIVRRQTLADVWSLDAVLADVPAPSPALDQPAPEHAVGARS